MLISCSKGPHGAVLRPKQNRRIGAHTARLGDQNTESKVVDTIKPFAGQFVARGGNLTAKGSIRTVVIEFPTREAAESWYKSPAYRKIIGLRPKSTSGSVIILDGM